ncbi:MAG: hypothetical protein LBF23_03185 [Endomicrobium sp.]|jgi:hypothetical protein|nr:hypothetical protein [Endomicrobium sp.]
MNYKYLIYVGVFTILAVFFSSFAFCSQMTDLINVTKYHNKGYKGQGIKCAIVDNTWAGWRGLSYINPAHARCFPGNTQLPDNPGSGSHGTGMAQTFHEIAPEAEIYLIDSEGGDISTEMINYFKAEGILLVSESLNGENFDVNFFLSGDDPCSQSLDTCVNNSITVCVIAGNEANKSCFLHLVKDHSSNQMMFPNGTENFNVIVTTSNAIRMIVTRTGSQRSCKYSYTVFNNTTNTQVYNKANVDVREVINISSGQVHLNDSLSLRVDKVNDTVDELDIIIGFRT